MYAAVGIANNEQLLKDEGVEERAVDCENACMRTAWDTARPAQR